MCTSGRIAFSPRSRSLYIERQPGMKAVDDVDFGERLVRALPQLGEHLLEAHRVRAGVAGTQTRKRAEETRRFADVGRLEPQVVIEIRAVAVTPFAFAIRQRAQGQQIRRLEQVTPSSNVSRSPAGDLFADVSKAVYQARSRFYPLRGRGSKPTTLPGPATPRRISIVLRRLWRRGTSDPTSDSDGKCHDVRDVGYTPRYNRLRLEQSGSGATAICRI